MAREAGWGDAGPQARSTGRLRKLDEAGKWLLPLGHQEKGSAGDTLILVQGSHLQNRKMIRLS